VIRYHARWVLPISRPPIRDGTVAVDGARIAYVGPRADAPPGGDRDLGRAVILPGLINAHTHLELTAFHGVIAPRAFREWIITLQALKTSVMTRERYLDSARLGIADGLRAGITTYADTCDSGVALEAMREMGVRGIMYQEVFGPDPSRADEAVRDLERKLAALEPLADEMRALGVSPHAPYTVSDELFRRAAALGRPMAVHLAESAEETALIRDGSGPFADGLRARGIPVAPRASSPVMLLERLGVLEARPLLIHCVRTDAYDIRLIAARGCAVAHCPRSNLLLGHGIAPLKQLLVAGVRVALGSDSMASNEAMDIAEEAFTAAAAQATRGHLTAYERAFELATLEGANALGIADRVGSLEPGKQADLAAFDVPDDDGLLDRSPADALFFLGPLRARATIVAGVEKVWDHTLVNDDPTLAERVRGTTEDLRRAAVTR